MIKNSNHYKGLKKKKRRIYCFSECISAGYGHMSLIMSLTIKVAS